MVGRIFIVLLESQCWISDDYEEKEIKKQKSRTKTVINSRENKTLNETGNNINLQGSAVNTTYMIVIIITLI